MSYGTEDCDSFRVRYLGSITFSAGSKRQGSGIDSLQRPLLDLYTTARRRGETHRSAHPLALTQELDVSSYGLVVAEAGENRENGTNVAIVTKVITPLSNITLWAAVRFHTRIVKRKVFGAAFVPLACSEAAVDQKSYVQLGSKQRFLVSLTHPSLFACLLRRVSSPKSFECHAFVCASAEDALTLSSFLGSLKDSGDNPTAILGRVVGGRYGVPPATRSFLSDENSFYTGDESPSDITPPAEPGHYTRSYLARSNDDFTAPQRPTEQPFSPELRRQKFRMYSEEDSPSDITLSKGHSNNRSGPPATPVANGGVGSLLNPRRLDTPPPDRRKLAGRLAHRKDKKRAKHYTHSAAMGYIRHPGGQEVTAMTPKANRGGGRAPRAADVGSESELWSERTEERWEPVVNWPSQGVVKKSHRSKVYLKNGRGRRGSSTTSGESYLSNRGGGARQRPPPPPPARSPTKKDMATMTEGAWETENSVLSLSDDPRPSHPSSKTAAAYAERRRQGSRRQSHEELSQTMELSSESEYSARDSDAWNARSPRVKYTYFGYETYSTPTSPDQVRLETTGKRQVFSAGEHPAPAHGRRKAVRNAETQADETTAISSDAMGKIVIAVPYQRTSHVPHGVRSFHKTGHVKNWSTLSQTSDLSYQGSATLPPVTKTARQAKVIRWSSDDRLPRRYGFLASLKRLSLKSLTKAKNKTGRFISRVRSRFKERVKGKKTPEGSEDSAYDTSEVCLSPNGHPNGCERPPQKTRRRLSWSFHDLRTANGSTVKRGRVVSPPGSALGASSARQLVHKRKHRRRRHHRHPDGSPSSSDSGVEEYQSDYSDTLNSLQKSESEMEHFAAEVTQVKVRHGMSKEAFHRWSQTNLQDELGYIP